MWGVEYTKYGTEKQTSSNWYKQSEIQLEQVECSGMQWQKQFQTQKQLWRIFCRDKGITVYAYCLFL